jgi:hypothetical protein
MANTDKNIVITPNNGSASDPNIVFSGANASTGAQNITLTVTPNNSGTVAFSGSAGQLLAINNNLTNTLSTGGTISATGNITANNFVGKLVGNVTGNFSGSLANGNSNVSIPAANGNVNISVVGVANVVVVTGTGANVTGTLRVSGNANVGNIGATNLSVTGNATIDYVRAIDANLTGALNLTVTPGNQQINKLNGELFITASASQPDYDGSIYLVPDPTYGLVQVTGPLVVTGGISGNGSSLSSITGANVTGQVGNALVAGTVYTNAQPNITSVGTLTSLSTSGNANVGNLGTTGLISATGNITGNYILGNGSQLTGIVTGTAATIANGNSNVNIPAANGNVNISAVGNANIVVVTGTGANITGTLSVSGNATSANLSTVNISSTGNITTGPGTGGTISGANLVSANFFTGTLTTAAQPNITSVGTLTTLSVSGNANIGNIGTAQVLATANITAPQLISNVVTGTAPLIVTSTTQVANLNVATAGTATTATSATNAAALLQNTSTATTVYPTFTTSSANGNSSAVINTSISANLGNASITATTFVGALSGAATSATTAGTVTTNAQPNITSVGTLTSLSVSGNITGANLIGPLANGNSNVNIPTANGNVNISAVGNANIVVVTGTGANITGTLNISGNTIGANIQALTFKTSGSAQSPAFWQEATVNATAGTAYGFLSRGTLAAQANSDMLFGYATGLGTANTGTTGLTGLTFYGVFSDGVSWSKTGNGTINNAYGVYASAPTIGTNNYAIFASGAVSVTGNITGGNLIGTSVTGTLTTAAQPNITSVGTLTSLSVTGNITANNISIGNVETVGVFTRYSNVTFLDNANAVAGNRIVVTMPTPATVNGMYSGVLKVYAIRQLDNPGGPRSQTTFKLSRVGNTTGANATFYVNEAVVDKTSAFAFQWYFDTTTGTPSLVIGQNTNSYNWYVESELNTSTIPTIAIGSSSGSYGTSYYPLYTLATPGTDAGGLTVTASNSSNTMVFDSTGQLSLAGNITGGNLIGVFANGNSSISIPTANGNINISAGGSPTEIVITTTGINVAGTLSVSGNANVGNLGTSGLITATGNITGGNLITSGLISATGALTASSYTAANSLVGYFLANTGTNVGKLFENGNIIKLEAMPATYGVALAANGTVQLSFDANGYGAIGSSSGTTGYALRIAKQTTGAVTAGSILINPTVQTDVTSTATGVRTSLNTAVGASPYTITNLVGYATYGGTIGANTTVTNQIAYYVDATATGGTNNWGFYGGLASAASTFNLYMQGTANNYLGGSLGIGSTNLSAINLRLSKSITGGTTAINFLSDGTISSDVTSLAVLNRASGITSNVTFTLANLIYHQAVQGTFGTLSTVTTQSGFTADSTLTGATNNYGFRGSIASGANRFNLYMDGTANNYIAGNVGIGTTSPAVALHIKQNAGSLNLEGTDQAFIQFYPRTVANIRTAYVGIGSAGSNNFTIRNDDNGRLALESGNSNVSVFANGNVTTTVAGVGNVVVVTSTGANIAGTLSATGNITGNYILGNGSQLTGITTATSLANGTSNVSIPAVNGNILFSTAGNANVVVINTLGYVGIGTSNPLVAVQMGGSSAYSELRLQRSGDTTIAQAIVFGKSRGTESAQTIVANGDTLGSILFNGNDGSGSTAGSIKVGAQIDVKVDGTPGTGNIPGRMNFYTTSSTGVSTERMRIDSSGNVGIGNGSPTTTLAVTGTVYVSGSANLNSTLTVSGNTTFSGTGQRIFADFSNATLASRTVFQSKTTDTSTDIPILPNGTAAGGSSLNTFNLSNIANSAYVVMGANSTVSRLYSATTGTATLLPLVFGVGSTEAARFDTSRNLLVGTTTTSGRLTVAAAAAANTATILSNGNISGNPNTSANIWKQAAFVANGGFGGGIALNNGGGSNDGYLMYLTSTPSQLNIQYGSNGGNTGSAGVTLTSAATSWSAFSDERLKTDLQPIANAIQKSSSLRTVTGRYKTDPEGTVRNFLLAQDVLPVVPSAVSTNEDGMLLLSRDELIPLLFATVNELSAQVAELKTEVNSLKNP